MHYLSQIINKKVYSKGVSVGRVIDLAMPNDGLTPFVSGILIRKGNSRFVLPMQSVRFHEHQWQLTDTTAKKIPYNENNFYLSEDLLDKQVIDINGRRLVRVNDVLLKENGVLKLDGIDIGLSGILRRLGLGALQTKTITLPWSLIEAFDYQTGDVQVKLAQANLNRLQPAEIADILEDAGTKERLGIVEALDAQRAASAIEEADTETQAAILEQVSTSLLKRIANRMHVSEIADVINQINPFTGRQILSSIGTEKAKRVKRLSVFADDVAGGLMDDSFIQIREDKTIADAIISLQEIHIRPEAIIVVDRDKKLIGTVNTRNFITTNLSIPLRDMIRTAHFVYPDAPFEEILHKFADYNLRILPVVSDKMQVLGIIKIDSLLANIQEEEEREDAV